MMSMFFRTVAATSRTLVQALTPAAVIILGLVMYTGFAIPTTYMLGWSRWINYINPIAYAFEALMINEFNNREFACSAFVPQGPQYANVPADSRICSTLGATPGSNVVQGSAYIIQSYAYYPSHRWRNFGILVAFTVFFLFTYLVATGMCHLDSHTLQKLTV
jgi:ATP-binding cassette subfamily G (WHITE) protein 2 (PDR)